MEKPTEVLFEYLTQILYRPHSAKLDISLLPDEYHKLAKGMEYMAKCYAQELNTIEAMANGYLSEDVPKSGSAFCLPLTELHTLLNSLTEKTNLVAKGDYSQRFMASGDFFEAFNEMVEQLDKNTKEILTEKKLVEQKNLELQRNAKFMQVLANDTHNMIFAFQQTSGIQLFANKTAKRMGNENPFLSRMLKNKLINHKMSTITDSETWEIQLLSNKDSEPIYYIVESFCASQEQEMLVVHILTDDTERRKNEELNHTDPLTGLHNKMYALDIMEKYIRSSEPFLLSFVDIDYLKYCNDKYGHEMGDEYLVKISEMLQSLECDVSRIGGDEFLLVKYGETKEAFDAKLLKLRNELENKGDEPYPMSFSFGTCAIPSDPEHTLSDYLRLADDTMYEFKTKYKKPLDDSEYKDDRI